MPKKKLQFRRSFEEVTSTVKVVVVAPIYRATPLLLLLSLSFCCRSSNNIARPAPQARPNACITAPRVIGAGPIGAIYRHKNI